MFRFRSHVDSGTADMVQRIRSFEEGVRKGLGIVIRCEGCGKKVVHRCWDFMGFIAPMADIEELPWRCSWCGTRRVWVRYTLIDGMGREGLAKWSPTEGMRKRW